MYRSVSFFVLLCLLAGCSALKSVKLITHGRTRQTTFKAEIPFEMRLGLIIVKVSIHGKEYEFLLDTGAPNVISKELAQELGLKPAVTRKTSDSQGNSASTGGVRIDSIGVGGIQFLETGAAILDLKKTPEIACLHVDGLLGANLMRKAMWQFDFEKHVITLASGREAFDIPAGTPAVKFSPALTGTPYMDVELNGISESMEVDLGSNGDFDSSTGLFKKLRKAGQLPSTYAYGSGSAGIYGHASPDTIRYALVQNIGIGPVKLNRQVVSFNSGNKPKLVGTNFFKHYRLILDWKSKEMLMINNTAYDNTVAKKFSFSRTFHDNKIFVGMVYASPAGAEDAPKIGDQIIELNGKDYRNCSADDWCDLLNKSRDSEPDNLLLVVVRDGKELHFNVSKKSLFDPAKP